jgi:signal transduction histidine kinase
MAFVPPTTPVPALLTDAVKLEHVLMNLLENAIKYAVAGSAITAQLAQEEGIIIRIENQTDRAEGPVLDLLQPYFRADPLGDGHGLGLWISHRLTELLGGQLRLTWQAFRFTAEVQLLATA